MERERERARVSPPSETIAFFHFRLHAGHALVLQNEKKARPEPPTRSLLALSLPCSLPHLSSSLSFALSLY